MSISSTARRAGPFFGNGVATNFSFDFKLFKPEELRVVRLLGVSNAEVDLVMGVDYDATLNADQDENPGGGVTLRAPLAVGDRLTLVSAVPELQPVDITNQGGFYPDLLNGGLDRATILVQQLKEASDRSLKLPVSSTEANLTLPPPKGNQLLTWNGDGSALVNRDPGELISVVTYGSTRADIFDGNGTQTSFALSASPGSVNNMQITIDGVMQVPGLDYTWGGGVALSFTSAPPAGTKVFVRYQEALDESTDVSGKADKSGGNLTDDDAASFRERLKAGGFNRGAWNADLNEPAVVSGQGVTGDFYTVTTAGTTELDGVGAWSVGDQLLFKGAAWTRLPAPTSEEGTDKGEWDALTNTPTLVSSAGTEGDFYTVSVAGSTPLNGVSSWAVGELVRFSGGVWIKDAPRVGKADVDGGNLSAAQAATFRKKLKISVFTPEDYGAVGDGVADDTAALKAAILARRAAGGVLKLSRKKYLFKEPLVDYGAYMAWQGENSVLVWDGPTTGDMVTFGQAGSELLFPLVAGLMVKTKKVMTSGWMMVAHAPARGVFRDIVIQGIDGAGEFGGRPYDGIYMNGYSYTKLVNLEVGGQVGSRVGLGVRGIPGGAQAGLWINGGSRLGGFDYLVQLGGGNGGVYFNDADIIGARKACVLQNNAYETQHNREFFFSSTVSIDTGGSEGCYIIDQNPGTCLVLFDKTWICSGQGTLSGPGPAPGTGAGLYLKRGPDVRLMGEVYLHNHGGDAFRCDEADCEVLLSGMILNNKGYGINRTTANQRVHSDGIVFRQNLLGDHSPAFAPVAEIDFDRVRVRHLQATNGIRVANGFEVAFDPNFYIMSAGGNDPLINFNPNTYHRFNRATGEQEFATSGANSLRLLGDFINVGGAGYVGYKVVTGTTNGSGAASVAHGISSLPSRVLFAQGWVTEPGGNVTGYVANNDGTNIGFSGATASRPFKIGIFYLKDAI